MLFKILIIIIIIVIDSKQGHIKLRYYLISISRILLTIYDYKRNRLFLYYSKIYNKLRYTIENSVILSDSIIKLNLSNVITPIIYSRNVIILLVIFSII